MTEPDPAQYEAFAAEYEAHAEEAPYNALYDRPATLALLGGLLLNLMPCVFPILSMKALSLVQAASGARRTARVHGLLYVGGVLLSFLLVAGILLALRAAGDSIGWGFQLQSSWSMLW